MIKGDPGTGKTIVAIYLMKLLSDIKNSDPSEPPDSDSLLSEFFVAGYPDLLTDFRVGLVVPQQSLRRSVEKVFAKTTGLLESMVLSAFEVGLSAERFDLLIVDETHRLNRRANQSSGMKNRQFAEINQKLFGRDDQAYTQLDWITSMSDHQVFLVDADQAVRPSDVSLKSLEALPHPASEQNRSYTLTSQMRVRADDDYVGYVRSILSASPPLPRSFPSYDLRLFDDFRDMRSELQAREQQYGLARLLAGYAWPWASKTDRGAYDIEIDGVEMRWNSSDVDWVSSKKSVDEVGSIHTIQGYDINYAGVIIGKDLRYDSSRERLYFDRANYYDKKGMENNRVLGITYSDDDLLQLVRNIYAVLMTRGMRGTYVYVCDQPLRQHLESFIPTV